MNFRRGTVKNLFCFQVKSILFSIFLKKHSFFKKIKKRIDMVGLADLYDIRGVGKVEKANALL